MKLSDVSQPGFDSTPCCSRDGAARRAYFPASPSIDGADSPTGEERLPAPARGSGGLGLHARWVWGMRSWRDLGSAEERRPPLGVPMAWRAMDDGARSAAIVSEIARAPTNPAHKDQHQSVARWCVSPRGVSRLCFSQQGSGANTCRRTGGTGVVPGCAILHPSALPSKRDSVDVLQPQGQQHSASEVGCKTRQDDEGDVGRAHAGNPQSE